MGRGPGRLLHCRSSATHQPQAWIECSDGGDDCVCQCPVRLRLVVQCAVRLDVVQRGAPGAGDDVEGTQLRHDQVMDFAGGQLLPPPTEPLAIVEPWVGADRHAVPYCHRYRCSHCVRVARVKSARHVSRGDELKECLVGFRIAFADVSV